MFIHVIEVFLTLLFVVITFALSIGAVIAIVAAFLPVDDLGIYCKKGKNEILLWLFKFVICLFVASFLFVLSFYSISFVCFINTGQYLPWSSL